MYCAIVINNTGFFFFFFFFPCLIKLLLLPQRKEKDKIITWIWLNKYVACRFQLECLQLQTMLSRMLMCLIVKMKRGCSGGISSVFYVSIIWEPFRKLTQSGFFLQCQNTEKRNFCFMVVVWFDFFCWQPNGRCKIVVEPYGRMFRWTMVSS